MPEIPSANEVRHKLPDPQPKDKPPSKEDDGDRARKIGLWVAVCLIFALLTGPSLKFSQVVYKAGEIAEKTVRSSADFYVEDGGMTADRKKAAVEDTPLVYDKNANALGDSLAAFDAYFPTDAKDQVSASKWTPKAIFNRWSVVIPKRLGDKLADPSQRVELKKLVYEILDKTYATGVVDNKERFLREAGDNGVLLLDPLANDRLVRSFPNLYDYNDLLQKHKILKSRQVDNLPDLAEVLAFSLLRPNIVYNDHETRLQKQRASDSVSPVLYKMNRGEIIVREGDRVTNDQALKLTTHSNNLSGVNRWSQYVVLFLGYLILFFVFYEFSKRNIRKAATDFRGLAFMATTFIFLMILERLDLAIIGKLDTDLAEALCFAVPLAAGLITLRLVLNSETVLAFSIPYLMAGAVGSGLGASFFLPVAVGGLVGAHFAKRAWRRLDFFKIGLYVGVAQALCVMVLTIGDGTAAGNIGIWAVGGAFFGGIFSGFLALGMVPITEAAFGYTTDVKLMELASLDHPLLKDLMIRAPGTYHHSMVTATLAKGAAEAIGARAVLSMVAAYYHDIGKCSKPTYFIENQDRGHNPHDKLSPSMSVLILTSHVKEGVELAEKFKLGRDITDIIQQSHGTSLIHYFHRKACQLAKPGVEEIHEEDFRYHGPKPQTREAALVMLADVVEAAARTLPDPSPARIQGMVQNLVNRVFADGQLDECNLALRDLHMIARSFTRILSGIHHQRIDYPLSAQKERKTDADTHQKRQPDGNDQRGEAPEESHENLKRLGM